MANNAIDNLRKFFVRLVIHPVDFDAGAGLSLLVSYLTDEGINLIDCQARSCLKVAGVLNFYWPLLTRCKLEVLNSLYAVIRVCLGRKG